MRRFPFELMGTEFVLSLHDSELRLVPWPQKHLLLQSDITIDDASSALRDSSDVERGLNGRKERMPSKSSSVAKTFVRAVFIALRVVCCVALMTEMYHKLVGKGALERKRCDLSVILR